MNVATVIDGCGDRHTLSFGKPKIAKEEKAYAQYPLPKFYNFPSVEARERIHYANFLKFNQKVKVMIAEIQEFYKK
ncbi:MAG: hypothetical protein PUF63_01475 [Prevotella sp.]|nr:hypothetical protein [Prevotella sp.]